MNMNQPLITSLPAEQAKMEFVIQYVLARAHTVDNVGSVSGIVSDGELAWARIADKNPKGLG
jgi:hypothetical protein